MDNASCEKDVPGGTHKSCAKVVDEADAPTKCCRGNEGHTWAGGPWLCAGQEDGDTCSYNQQCGPNSRCEGGVCKPKVAMGGACAERSDCVSGSQCAYGAAGNICCHNEHCNGVGCGNGGGWCKDHTEGQVCKDDGMCDGNHHCKGGVCTAKLADGNTCGDSKDCTNGNCSCGVCGGCGTRGQNCEGGTCGAPVNCVGEWGAYTGPCNDRKATYTVSTHARYGGAGCPHHHGEVHTTKIPCPEHHGCSHDSECGSGLCGWTRHDTGYICCATSRGEGKGGAHCNNIPDTGWCDNDGQCAGGKCESGVCRSIDQRNLGQNCWGSCGAAGHCDHFCGGDAKCCRYNHWDSHNNGCVGHGGGGYHACTAV